MDLVIPEHNKESLIDHPKHYNQGNIEVIDVIEDWNLTFNVGNSLKYIGRLGYKDSVIQELHKSSWYINREINRITDAQLKYSYKGLLTYSYIDVVDDWKLTDNLSKTLKHFYYINGSPYYEKLDHLNSIALLLTSEIKLRQAIS